MFSHMVSELTGYNLGCILSTVSRLSYYSWQIIGDRGGGELILIEYLLCPKIFTYIISFNM